MRLYSYLAKNTKMCYTYDGLSRVTAIRCYHGAERIRIHACEILHPELRRFINADVIAGEISNAITLNRYAYANGNPVSNIDPFGLSAKRNTYVVEKMQENSEPLYELMKLLGIQIGVDNSKSIGIDVYGTFLKFSWIVSYETETDSNITVNLTNDKLQNIISTDLPNGEGRLSYGRYSSWKNFTSGEVTALQYGEYTFALGTEKD